MIVLVGMPGSGKSTIGRALARRLKLDFADSDQVIERRLQRSIRSYFDSDGEAAFRDLEQDVLAELAHEGVGVLATGGGAVLRQANRDVLRAHGTVIYLHVSVERLYRRLSQDTRRPLLQVADPRARLQDLYAERDPLYRACSHFVINTQRSSRAMLVGRIIMQLELMPDAPLDAADAD